MKSDMKSDMTLSTFDDFLSYQRKAAEEEDRVFKEYMKALRLSMLKEVDKACEHWIDQLDQIYERLIAQLDRICKKV